MDLLTDLQVVDCSSGIPGGYCAKLLGDAGADVVKVEGPEGDPLRRWTNQGYWSGADPHAADGGARCSSSSTSATARSHDPRRSATEAVVDDELDALLAGADILITDAQGLAADPTALHERYPAAGRRRHHALRPARPVRRPAVHRDHPAGRERRAGRARPPEPGAGAGRRPHDGVGQRALRRGRRAGRDARGAPRRTGRARRPLHVGGGEHHRHRPRPTSWTRCAAARTRRARGAASRPRRSSRPPTATSGSTPTPGPSSTASC